jgi:chaperonin cofactor prefoldin
MKEVWSGIIIAIVAAVGSALLTWSNVQTHEYRLDKVEATFETHLKNHDDQNKEIRQTLMEIKEAIGRLNGRDISK